jgi:hypothetical protein
MGFFSKNTTPTPATPAAMPPRPAAVAVENPKTAVLSFLHESSKNTGMREFVKNYTFQSLTEQRFLVVVEMKESCMRTPGSILLARWQLFQLGAIRWATAKNIPLVGIACTFPLDKSTPLSDLREHAQLNRDPSANGQDQSSALNASVSRFDTQPSRMMVEAAPESQIEVNHDNSDVAEEFFRLTQPPPSNF